MTEINEIDVLKNENKALERELVRVIRERDIAHAEIDSRDRKQLIYGTYGNEKYKLAAYCDRLVEDRNEFEYYMTMYKRMSEDLMEYNNYLKGQLQMRGETNWKIHPYEK